MGLNPPPTVRVRSGPPPPEPPPPFEFGQQGPPLPYPYSFSFPCSPAVATSAAPVAARTATAPTAVSEPRNNQSNVQNLEAQESKWEKELEALNLEKKALKNKIKVLSATSKRQQDEIQYLTNQASVQKNQALERDLSKRMAQNKQQRILMEDLVKKRNQAETKMKTEIASLLRTIANINKRQAKQQQTESDKVQHENEETETEDEQDEQEENTSSKHDGPFQILVQGAGALEVNGTYKQDGYSEKACRYLKVGKYKGKNCKFYILLCQTDDKTKLWYITIVPDGVGPGTINDIDFYFTVVTATSHRIPPLKGWISANRGRFPAPTIAFRNNKSETEKKIAKACVKATISGSKKSPVVQKKAGTVAHQQQRDHHRHHESSELSSLRATVANLDRENEKGKLQASPGENCSL
jgi:chemotaxis protein histidine kinase CheA